jgi:hypothetical protein
MKILLLSLALLGIGFSALIIKYHNEIWGTPSAATVVSNHNRDLDPEPTPPIFDDPTPRVSTTAESQSDSTSAAKGTGSLIKDCAEEFVRKANVRIIRYETGEPGLAERYPLLISREHVPTGITVYPIRVHCYVEQNSEYIFIDLLAWGNEFRDECYCPLHLEEFNSGTMYPKVSWLFTAGVEETQNDAANTEELKSKEDSFLRSKNPPSKVPSTGILIRSPKVPYPAQAISEKVSGAIKLQIKVTKGEIVNVEYSGPTLLGKYAASWVQQNWKFRSDADGTYTVPMSFQLTK